jgi:hypothetical protein
MAVDKESLLKEWVKYKKAEDKAKLNRYEVESAIIDLYGDFKETSKSFKEEELGFKVNLKKSIAHKLDQEAYLSIRNDIPEDLRPEKITFALDVKGFEWLQANDQENYLKISECVTIKENKTTVKVEKI